MEQCILICTLQFVLKLLLFCLVFISIGLLQKRLLFQLERSLVNCHVHWKQGFNSGSLCTDAACPKSVEYFLCSDFQHLGFILILIMYKLILIIFALAFSWSIACFFLKQIVALWETSAQCTAATAKVALTAHSKLVTSATKKDQGHKCTRTLADLPPRHNLSTYKYSVVFFIAKSNAMNSLHNKMMGISWPKCLQPPTMVLMTIYWMIKVGQRNVAMSFTKRTLRHSAIYYRGLSHVKFHLLTWKCSI